MKYRGSILIPLLLLLSTAACEATPAAESTILPPTQTPILQLEERPGFSGPTRCYAEPMTMETIFASATDLVKGTLASIEDLNGSAFIYTIDVDEDYTGAAPSQIHIRGGYDTQFIVGHTYYFYLYDERTTCYPYPVYSLVYHELLDITAHPQGMITLAGDPFRAEEADALMREAAAQGQVGTKHRLLELSESDDLSEVAQEADLILEAKLFDACQMNPYVSHYRVEVLNCLKGTQEPQEFTLSLPSGLALGETCYLFLKEDPDFHGQYLPFSRQFLAVLTTEEITWQLTLDGQV